MTLTLLFNQDCSFTLCGACLWGQQSCESTMVARHPILRTVHMDPDLDNALHDEAFARRVKKNDLLLDYLRLGMCAVEEARRTHPNFTVAEYLAQPSKYDDTLAV